SREVKTVQRAHQPDAAGAHQLSQLHGWSAGADLPRDMIDQPQVALEQLGSSLRIAGRSVPCPERVGKAGGGAFGANRGHSALRAIAGRSRRSSTVDFRV